MYTNNNDIDNNRRDGILASSMASVLRPPPVVQVFCGIIRKQKLSGGGVFLKEKGLTN